MNRYNWGYSPRVDFRSITLLYIKKLRIVCFTFSHDWQLDWLSSLKTLEQLVLDSCAIITHVFSHQPLNHESYLTNETPVCFKQAIDLTWDGLPVYLYMTRWSDYFNTLPTP